jgi:hypothetical protein
MNGAIYVTPRDRAIAEILKELRTMAMPDLACLRAQAQALNRARLQQEADLAARYPLVWESPDHGE